MAHCCSACASSRSSRRARTAHGPAARRSRPTASRRARTSPAATCSNSVSSLESAAARSPGLSATALAGRSRSLTRNDPHIGCGVGLPGLTCARLGARRVHLTDLPHPALLAAVKEAAAANGVADRVDVRGHRWGDAEGLPEGGADVVLAADVFFSSVDHEDVLASAVAALRPGGRFLVAYENRVATREIHYLIAKWRLSARHLPLESFLSYDDDEDDDGDDEEDAEAYASLALFEIVPEALEAPP
mmetsp:Transcript_32020/g.101909  ORF Transcript_32020/g.101909 Transcript_32020/m.101909 type:complete len:246 (-) Transcript_32020:42-779(-)